MVALTNTGIPIKSTMDEDQTNLWAYLVAECISKVRSVGKIIEKGSHVTMLRIRTRKYEVMIALEKEYSLLVIHRQSDSDSDHEDEN